MGTKKGLLFKGLAVVALSALAWNGETQAGAAADEARKQQQLGELANAQFEMAKAMGTYFNNLGKTGEIAATQGMQQADQKMVNLVHQRNEETHRQFYGKVYRLDGAVIDQKEFEKNPDKYLAENGEYDPDSDLSLQGSGGSTVQKLHASGGPVTSEEFASTGGTPPLAPEARPEVTVDGTNVPKVLEFPGKAKKRVPASQ